MTPALTVTLAIALAALGEALLHLREVRVERALLVGREDRAQRGGALPHALLHRRAIGGRALRTLALRVALALFAARAIGVRAVGAPLLLQVCDARLLVRGERDALEEERLRPAASAAMTFGLRGAAVALCRRLCGGDTGAQRERETQRSEKSRGTHVHLPIRIGRGDNRLGGFGRSYRNGRVAVPAMSRTARWRHELHEPRRRYRTRQATPAERRPGVCLLPTGRRRTGCGAITVGSAEDLMKKLAAGRTDMLVCAGIALMMSAAIATAQSTGATSSTRIPVTKDRTTGAASASGRTGTAGGQLAPSSFDTTSTGYGPSNYTGTANGDLMSVMPSDLMSADSLAVLGFADPDIVAHLTMGDSMEVAMSQPEAQSAADTAVRAFAQMLVSDHSQALAQDRALEQQVNAGAPSPADTADARMMNMMMHRMSAMSGSGNSDRAFVAMQRMHHQHMLNELQMMRSRASNPAVRQQIDNAIPVVQRHLARAQQLAESMGIPAQMNRRGGMNHMNGMNGMSGMHGMNGMRDTTMNRGGMRDTSTTNPKRPPL